MSPDGRTLYLAIQSPLSNPDSKMATQSRVVRVVAFDIVASRFTAEYAYPMGWIDESDTAAKPVKAPKPERVARPGRVEKPVKPAKPAKPDTEATRVSGLAPVGTSQLLVLERTSEDARLYLVDLNGAVNLIGSRWDDPATTPSLEALADPSTEGVMPLAKTLVADLSAIPEVPEKIEGIAIIDASTVAVANDNDFDIGDIDQFGNNIGAGLKSQILMVRLPQPLP